MFERHDRINKHRTIALPFILVSTTDTPDNEVSTIARLNSELQVEIAYGDDKTQLNIAMKKPLKVYEIGRAHV